MRSNHRHFVLPTWLTLVIIATSCLAQAQPQTATIIGTVTDPTGAVIPNAVVSLESSEMTTQRMDTDEHGLFAIKSRPGDYIFRVAAQGFFTYDISIHLNNAAIIRKHVMLNVGSCSPCITVQHVAPPLETLDSSLASLLSLNPTPPLNFSGKHLHRLRR